MSKMPTAEFIIRFDDGSYNWGLGHPATKADATRYATKESAESMAEDLVGVEAIEEVDSP